MRTEAGRSGREGALPFAAGKAEAAFIAVRRAGHMAPTRDCAVLATGNEREADPMDRRTNGRSDRTSPATRALLTGTVAGLASAAALALLAKAEGKGALRPINATSHWLHGEQAAECDELDATHTLVGFATHYASAVFWALPFEFWRAWRHPSSAGALLRDACMTSAVAAAVDYGPTPKRFTPGWELVLGTRSLVVAYGVLALGLAFGTKLAQALAGSD
jgi:hypothetical protein